MRITAEAKTATRDRILATAAKLLAREGWEGTTTRDIATAAGIATGTLFNYFDSKEAVAAALISEAFEKSQKEFEARKVPGQSLEEDLFQVIWTGLRSLRKLKRAMASAADTIFSPLARSSQCAGNEIRASHLDLVDQLIREHGGASPLPPVTLQLYWTLYLGVFSYWAADDSSNQEDTLALLDQSLKLFAGSLTREKGTSYGSETD